MSKNTASASKALGYLIVMLGGFFYCYEYFLRITPAVIKPDLMHTFALDATMFGTLSACYFYAYTPLQLVVGIIVDRYRVKRVLIFAVIACTIGTFLIGSTHSFYLAAFGRLLQGIGSAFAFVGALKLAALWVPSNRFAAFAGMAGSLGFLGAGIGEVALSNIQQHIGWRLTVQGLGGIGIILTILFFIMIWFTSRNPRHRKQFPPAHIKHSLKHLWQAMKVPRIWLAGMFAGFMFLPTTVFAALWGVPYLQMLHHYTQAHAALATSMIFYGWAIGSATTGWISDWLKTRTPLMRIGSLIAACLAVLLLYVQALPFWSVCILFVVFGWISSVETLSFVIAKELSPSKNGVGTAIALINTLTMLGGMLFQRGVGEILDWSWSGQMIHGMRVYSLVDYEHAIVVVPISLVCAFIVSLFIKDTIRYPATPKVNPAKRGKPAGH